MDTSVKKQVVRRLAIAEGHLKKVRQMVEEDKYCPDVMHQSQAVQAALKKIDELVLRGHLNTCVLGEGHHAKLPKKQVVDEIVGLFHKNSLSV
ncbi:MAG: metal-sensing transcriptional repressor [Candidatus Chisholmbacteria bacterium]|nr:metal-sensing transcriptional repressor [Candidatus Chisholmbacteria bacterium]